MTRIDQAVEFAVRLGLADVARSCEAAAGAGPDDVGRRLGVAPEVFRLLLDLAARVEGSTASEEADLEFLEAVRLVRARPAASDDPGAPATCDLFAGVPAAGRSAGEEGSPRLGRYRDVRPLNAGGFGEILVARDPDAGREVAVKTLRPSRRSDRRILARFLREAQVTAQLEHPNIVPVYEVGLGADGTLYFAMKRVRGQSLAEMLGALGRAREAVDSRRGRGLPDVRFDDRTAYPLARRLADFVKVCDAVAFAHARGVVHRDLKPANVMVGEFGEVLVVDWGLARLLGRDELEPGAVEVSPEALLERFGEPGAAAEVETLEGSILGTLPYMSPEQAEGRRDAIDERSDVYALGAILYELLTLTPAFGGSDFRLVLSRIVRAEFEPPARRAGAPVPAELEAVVLRAMARRPADRYASVDDLRADVEAWLEGRILVAYRYSFLERAARWVARHRALVGGAAAIAATALLLAGGFAWRDRTARRAEAREAVARAGEALDLVPEEAAWPVRSDPFQVEDDEERRRRDAALGTVLAAMRELDRAERATGDDAPVRELRVRCGRLLARIALAGGDFGLARRAYADLARSGAPAPEVEALVARVDAAEQAVPCARVERLAAMLAGVGSGRSAELPEDLVFEAAGFRDPRSVAFLSERLAELAARGRARPEPARWSDAERRLALFLTRVLGRLGRSDAAEALAGWIEVAGDEDLVVEAAIALARTGSPIAFGHVLRLRSRLGQESLAWARIERHLERLPRPGAVADPNPPDLWALGVYHETTGEFDEARRCHEAALALDPAFGPSLLHLGALLARAGGPEEALAHLDRAIEARPDDAATWMGRAAVLAGLGRVEAALADLDQAVRAQPDRPVAWTNRGILLQRLGRPAEAIDSLDRAIRLDPRSADAYEARGTTRLAAGDPVRALLDLDRALALDDRNAAALANRGVARVRLAQLDEALADFGRLLELDPDHAGARYHRAQIRRLKGDVAGAREDVEAGLATDPASTSLRLERARLLWIEDDLDGAEREAEACRADAGSAAEADFILGNVHAARGAAARAIACYDRVLAAEPAHHPALANRGLVRFQAGQREAGLADYRRAAEGTGDDPELWFHLGEMQRALGDLDGALASFRRSLDLSPAGETERVREEIRRTEAIGR